MAGTAAAIGAGAAAYTAGTLLAGPWSGGAGTAGMLPGSGSVDFIDPGNPILVQTHVGLTTGPAVPVPEPPAAALLLLPLAVLALCAVRRSRRRRS